MRMQRSDNINNNNNDDNNNNSSSSNNSSFVPHPACAACKHQRRKCDNKCLLYPYFPPERTMAFQAVHKVYGVSNVSKMILSVREQDRTNVVESLIWEAMWRKKDPLFGAYGVCRRLQEQLVCYRRLSFEQAAQLNQLTTLYKLPSSSNLVGWNPINNHGETDNHGGQATDVNTNTAVTSNYIPGNDAIINSSPHNCPSNAVQIPANLQEKEVAFVGQVQQYFHDDFNNHPQCFPSSTLKDESKNNC